MDLIQDGRYHNLIIIQKYFNIIHLATKCQCDSSKDYLCFPPRQWRQLIKRRKRFV